MTTAKPPARYGAIGGASRRLCSTELHHHWGHDLPNKGGAKRESFELKKPLTNVADKNYDATSNTRRP